MKTFLFVSISLTLALAACKSSKQSTAELDENGKEPWPPVVLSINLQVEKKNEVNDLEVIHLNVDTLANLTNPKPLDDAPPETFKIEVLNSSNSIVFGSKYGTNFIEKNGKNVAFVKFFCTVPNDAVRFKVYHQVSEGVWKQVVEHEL